MIENTASSFFIVPPLAKQAEFYQELLRGVESYRRLGNRLIQIAEQAHAFRQFDKVKEAGQVLSNISIKHYQSIGYYFLAVAANNNGNGDQEKAGRLFELVADTAPSVYKAKAILSLAGVSANTGKYDSEIHYFAESLKASKDLGTTLTTYRGMAVYKAREGFHKRALDDLERLLSVIRYAPPLVYFDYMNSLAVELSEAGRLEEAKNISALVCSSPFAPYYKEWQETLSEVNLKLYKSRSTVRVSKITQQESQEELPAISAKVLPFPTQAKSEVEEIAPSDTIEPKSEINKVFQFDSKELEATICNWMNGDISPEEFASVLLSLRNIKSAARKNDILNKMIHYTFLQTPQAKEAEAAWINSLYVEIAPEE